MRLIELVMKIFKRLEQAEQANFDKDDSAYEDAAEDIHAWLVEEIPSSIRKELSEEAFDEHTDTILDDAIDEVIVTLQYRELFAEKGLDTLTETVRENHIPELAKIIMQRIIR